MRPPLPRRKSKLQPLAKSVLAAQVLLDFRDDKLDLKQAGLRLREAIGLQWTVLTAAQYLTGKEAIQALSGLPADWQEGPWTKRHMAEALLFANLLCAQGHPNGSQLSAGTLVPAFRADGEIGKLLRDMQEKSDRKPED